MIVALSFPPVLFLQVNGKWCNRQQQEFVFFFGK